MPVFLDDLDYQLYLRLLARTVSRYAWTILAFCLMPNHLHLLVRLGEPSLSAGMQRQQGLYARRFNERYGLTGHVFQARFHGTHDADEAHLLQTVRYVVQNPVTAGLCDSPEDWPWSSHRAVSGLIHRGSPVAVKAARALFGEVDPLPRYAAFVDGR